jgi:hypothetical protein
MPLAKSAIKKEVPLDVAGSTTFGRYSKISRSETFNFILSDGWNVPYGGHQLSVTLNANGIGRGLLTSFPGNHMVAVVGNAVLWIATNLSFTQVGTIDSEVGNVSIAEDDQNNIAICDGNDITIFNYATSSFYTIATDFTPIYVSFQGGQFLAGDANNPQWRLSEYDMSGNVIFPNDAQHVGSFLVKADNVNAIFPLPGHTNLIYVMGSIVTLPWYRLGTLQLFPFQLSQSFNIDYGTLNNASIASNENMCCWLAQNEKSQCVIMYSTGSDIKQISNDGISYKLANLTAPSDCYGNMFKQDGHLLYQMTFPTDNLCYVFDFNTEKFFTITDQNLNYHIARKIALFNNQNYFVSNIDGNLYAFGTQYTTYNGEEIPRIRICRPVRQANSKPFIVSDLSFTIEQGNDDIYDNIITESTFSLMNGQDFLLMNGQNFDLNGDEDIPAESIFPPRVDMSISIDGGVTFSSYDSVTLNKVGLGANRLTFWQLGYANDMVCQFRFYGFGRFTATDGVINLY